MEIKKKYKAAFETFKLPNVLKLLEMRVKKDLPKSNLDYSRVEVAAAARKWPMKL